MIVFDLSCAENHKFEAWFRSSSDFQNQLERGLVICPHCGCVEVMKAPMAPAVPLKSNQISMSKPAVGTVSEPRSTGVAGGKVSPEFRKALGKLAEVQAQALKDSTWVGSDFAETSRQMHYGEKDSAIIHGQATAEEAKGLVEEGIAIAPLPFPIAPPKDVN